MKNYFDLLQREPVLRRLAVIQSIAYFGAWFSNVAIYTLLIQLGANPLIVALTAALHFLPGVIQAPLSGVLIDRYHPKRLMLLLIVIEIGSTFPLVLVDQLYELWILFVLVFLRMAAASFYFTLEMSLLPRILSSRDLKLANEIHSMIWSFSYTIGMALSGLLVYWVGVKVAFILDGSLFVLALFLLMPLKLPALQVEHVKESVMESMRKGWSYLKSTPLVMHLILFHAFVGFTAFDALVALMAEAYYVPAIAASLAIGMLHASRALGLVFGPMFLGKLINNRRLGLFFLFQGLAIIAWALVVESFILSLVVSFFVGLTTTTLWSYTYTLLQVHTDKAFYGRIVSYNDMAFLLTVSVVSLIIGALADTGVSLDIITGSMGTVFLFGMAYIQWIRKHYDLKEITDDL